MIIKKKKKRGLWVIEDSVEYLVHEEYAEEKSVKSQRKA